MRTRRGEGERGAVLVEFAVAVAVMMTVLLAVVEFGQALFTYDLVSNAARIGTRYAIVRGTACTVAGCPTDAAHVASYVQEQSPGVDETQLSVVTTWSPDPGAGCAVTNGSTVGTYQHPGCLVAVNVSYPVHFLFRYTLTMSSSSQMVISQ